MRRPALLLACLLLGTLTAEVIAQDNAAVRRANIRAKTEREAALQKARARSHQRFVAWKRSALAAQEGQAVRTPPRLAREPRQGQPATDPTSTGAFRKRVNALRQAKAAAAGTRRAPAGRAPVRPTRPATKPR